MTTWAVILAVGAGSFLFRAGPLLLLQRATLSESADRTIRFAGLAAVSGLIATSVRHTAHDSSTVPVVLAVACGALLAKRGSSMSRIIMVGGALYAGASAIIGVLG